MKTFNQFITLLLCFLLSAPATFAQRETPAKAAQSQDVTIIIQQDKVRFTSQKPIQMMQLQIVNQSGEQVYDSGPMTVAEVNWTLQTANGEALKSGLYAYTLAIHESGAATARVRRGHFIVDRVQDRDGKTDKLWVTSQQDSGIGTELTVARNEDSTVAGTSMTNERSTATSRETTQREVAGRNETKSTSANDQPKLEAASGTIGQIAKFTTGADLGNSVMIEKNGNIGIGLTSFRSTAKFEVNGSMYLTTTGNGGDLSFGTPNGETGIGFRKLGGLPRADIRFDESTLKLVAGKGDGGPPSSLNGIAVHVSGNVGIGTITPRFKLEVVGGDNTGIAGFSMGNVGVYGESAQYNGVRGVAYRLEHGAVVGIHNGGGFGLYGQSSGHGVVGSSQGNGIGVYGESAQCEGVRGLAHDVNHGGVVGIHAENGIGIYGTSGGTGVQGDSTSVTGFGGIFRNTAGGAGLKVVGTAIVDSLEITGGADFAENFDVSAVNSEAEELKVEAGMVVTIDPLNPGKLALSTQSYDRRVAGIISGAGGVNPGMRMSQTGTLADGQHPVALSGRVYCWVDASQGAIEPGDFLTTSNTPGHAMKVTNSAKAQGTIIGKAMTSLKEGKGLVLVLVTLQ